MFTYHTTTLKFAFCLILFAVIVNSKNVNFKVCGQELTDTIRRYCNGKYNTRTPAFEAKRSSNRVFGFELSPNDQSMLENDMFLQSLDIPPNDYAAFGEIPSRERRQGLFLVSNIVNECCKNACTLRTLMSYCYETVV